MFKKRNTYLYKIYTAIDDLCGHVSEMRSHFKTLEDLVKRVNTMEDMWIDSGITCDQLNFTETMVLTNDKGEKVELERDCRTGMFTNIKYLVKIVRVDKEGKASNYKTALVNLTEDEKEYYKSYGFVLNAPINMGMKASFSAGEEK